MGTSERGDSSSPAPVADAPRPMPAAYEPPAVVWEETFDPVAQADSCIDNPHPGCGGGGET